MSATNYAEQKILDHLLGTTSFTMPAAPWIKLHTGDPGEDATANAAGNTTRKQVTFGATASPSGVATSTSSADWTNVSTAETYSWYSTWDASTGGNPLLVGQLTAAVTVAVGDNFSLPIGSLTATAA